METLIRMIHAKFQTSDDNVAKSWCLLPDFTEKWIFPFIKGIWGILRGKWVAAAKLLTATNFCSYYLKVFTDMLLWCKFQVFWTIFGWFRAHVRSKSGIFPSNFTKGKSWFRAYLFAQKRPPNRQTRLFLHSVKSFGLLNKFSLISTLLDFGQFLGTFFVLTPPLTPNSQSFNKPF